jgi:hypothetical protein
VQPTDFLGKWVEASFDLGALAARTEVDRNQDSPDDLFPMSEENTEKDDQDFMRPTALGLAICDSICQDLATGKFSLIGMFGVFVAPALPLRANFAAHATITSVRENLEIKFMIVDDEDNVIFQSPIGETWIQLSKPADVMIEANLISQFMGVEFPRHGSYFVQVWTRKCSIMERRILVIEPTRQPEELA